MRLHCVALLAVSLFGISTESCLGADIATSSLTTGPYDVPTKRVLRSHNDLTKENEEDDEDRGVSTTAVESLSNALKVDTKQLEAWLNGGKSTDDVFKLLILDDAVDNVLAHPKLQPYLDYMKFFNKQNPKKQTSLVTTLASNYGNDGLSKIIVAAKKVPATEKLAKRLETEQIQRWLFQEKTPDEIFNLLKLDQMRYDLFEKPQLFTWVKYVDDFNKMYPNQKTTLFAKLRPTLDEGALVDMLINAKSIPTTEKIALRIQGEQTSYWLKNQKTPEDLFTLLRLNKVSDNLLENPIFDAWIKYADDFREMYPKDSLNTIATMEEFYSSKKIATMIVEATNSPNTEKLAYRLNSEQFRNWIMSKSNPVDVFTQLELKNAGDKIFRDPLIPTWLKYVSFYNERKAKNKQVSVTSMLRKRFGDERLAGMLIDAKAEVASIRSVVSRMLNSLALRMVRSGVEPANMYKWLRVEGRPKEDEIRHTYETYAKAYTKALAEAS